MTLWQKKFKSYKSCALSVIIFLLLIVYPFSPSFSPPPPPLPPLLLRRHHSFLFRLPWTLSRSGWFTYVDRLSIGSIRIYHCIIYSSQNISYTKTRNHPSVDHAPALYSSLGVRDNLDKSTYHRGSCLGTLASTEKGRSSVSPGSWPWDIWPWPSVWPSGCASGFCNPQPGSEWVLMWNGCSLNRCGRSCRWGSRLSNYLIKWVIEVIDTNKPSGKWTNKIHNGEETRRFH